MNPLSSSTTHPDKPTKHIPRLPGIFSIQLKGLWGRILNCELSFFALIDPRVLFRLFPPDDLYEIHLHLLVIGHGGRLFRIKKLLDIVYRIGADLLDQPCAIFSGFLGGFTRFHNTVYPFIFLLLFPLPTVTFC